MPPQITTHATTHGHNSVLAFRGKAAHAEEQAATNSEGLINPVVTTSAVTIRRVLGANLLPANPTAADFDVVPGIAGLNAAAAVVVSIPAIAVALTGFVSPTAISHCGNTCNEDGQRRDEKGPHQHEDQFDRYRQDGPSAGPKTSAI